MKGKKDWRPLSQNAEKFPRLAVAGCLLFCRRFRRLRFRPVIEIMRDVMTIAAFLEFSHNPSFMWHPMESLQAGTILCFSWWQTAHAKGLCLVPLALRRSKPSLTRTAVLWRDISCIGHLFRYVVLVTFFAVCDNHFRWMGFVTLVTEDLAVYAVTPEQSIRLCLLLLSLSCTICCGWQVHTHLLLCRQKHV